MTRVMAPAIVEKQPRSRRPFWHEFVYTRASLLGLCIVGAAVVIALITPALPLPDPTALSADTYASPSPAHLFGTDNLGRDVFSSVLWGTRLSLLFGVVVASLSAVLGIVLGTLPGYFGGIVDDAFSRFFELFLSIPALVLLIVVVTILGTNLFVIMVIVGLTVWPSTAKIMRAQVLSQKQRDYVMAARAAGARDFWIMTRHIVPNAVQPVIANSTLLIGSAIVLEASLSFLGLGDANIISWGRLLRSAQAYYYNAWWMGVFPGLAITVTVLGFTLLGDALNRILSPTERTLLGLRGR